MPERDATSCPSPGDKVVKSMYRCVYRSSVAWRHCTIRKPAQQQRVSFEEYPLYRKGTPLHDHFDALQQHRVVSLNHDESD